MSTCTDISNITNTTEVTIYPNPNNGLFSITTSTITDKLEVSITNALGQIVKTEMTQHTSQLQVNMSDMSKGIYYLTVTTTQGRKIVKLIVE